MVGLKSQFYLINHCILTYFVVINFWCVFWFIIELFPIYCKWRISLIAVYLHRFLQLCIVSSSSSAEYPTIPMLKNMEKEYHGLFSGIPIVLLHISSKTSTAENRSPTMRSYKEGGKIRRVNKNSTFQLPLPWTSFADFVKIKRVRKCVKMSVRVRLISCWRRCYLLCAHLYIGRV